MLLGHPHVSLRDGATAKQWEASQIMLRLVSFKVNSSVCSSQWAEQRNSHRNNTAANNTHVSKGAKQKLASVAK